MAELQTKPGLRSAAFRGYTVAQFFDAFNDNVLKMVVLLVVSRGLKASEGGGRYLAGATAAFSLAYLLFSSWAGYLADRYSKQRVLVWAKLAEAGVMVLAYFALLSGSRVWPVVALFLMASQSTFFSPAKYGILPELLEDEDLSQGNGVTSMVTWLAIVTGSVVGGWLMTAMKPGIENIAWVLVGTALLGTAACTRVARVPASGARRAFRWDTVVDSVRGLRRVRRERGLFVTVVACAFVWAFGAAFFQNFPPYAVEVLKVSGPSAEGVIGTLLGALAVGIALGSVLAGRWSRWKVELGLVPLGAVGMTACSLGFVLTAAPGEMWVRLGLTGANQLLLGIFSGLFVVPLNAYIQQRSPREGRGETIGVLNFVTFAGILVAAVGVFVLCEVLGLSPAAIFVAFGLMTAAVAVWVCRALPEVPVRFVAWAWSRVMCRLRVTGAGRVPREGPALLVSNRAAAADWLAVTASLQRPVRFIYGKYRAGPLAPWGLRVLRAIPVAAENGAAAREAAFEEARRALLERGELVCVFVDTDVVRPRRLLGPGCGFEAIVRGTDVPMVPVQIDREPVSGRRARVRILFGRPIGASSRADEVRTAMAELGAKAFLRRREAGESLHGAFIRVAKSNWRKACVADTTGTRLSYGRLLVASALLGGRVRAAEGRYVGVMLPPSVGGAVANLAVLFAGKVPVNLNYTGPRESVRSAMERCGTKMVLTSRRFLEKVGIELTPEMVMVEEVLAQMSRWARVRTALAAYVLPSSVLRLMWCGRRAGAEDTATVVFSSGSAGTPKGAVLSHRNVLSNIAGFCEVLPFGRADCMCGVLPFFHSFGLTTTLWAPLLRAFRAVYHSSPLEGKAVGRLVREGGATHLMSTPTFLMLYTRQCEAEDFRTLRVVVTGAEKLRKRVADAFAARFGVRPLEGYGCTELSPVVSVNAPDEPLGGDEVRVGTRAGTIGRPLPNVAVKVVDILTGEMLPPGREGLLEVKGPNVMVGYLGEPERTAEAIHDGWYQTGDVARIDDDGFITITDRLARFSKVGGEMVPHFAVEEAIYGVLGSSPGEHLCVVTSAADEERGERLAVLHVRLPVSVDELWSRLNATALPKLWVPRKEMFHEVSEIPVLASGKLDLGRARRVAEAVWGKSKEKE